MNPPRIQFECLDGLNGRAALKRNRIIYIESNVLIHARKGRVRKMKERRKNCENRDVVATAEKLVLLK